MKKFVALCVAILFLSGCARTTIKPQKKQLPVKKTEPAEKSFVKPVIKPAPKPVVEDEDIK